MLTEDNIKKLLGDDLEIFVEFMEGRMTISTIANKEEIFAYKDRFFLIYGGDCIIEEIEDRQKALRIFLRIYFCDDFKTDEFNLKECLSIITNKIYQYNNSYLYVDEDNIMTNDFQRANFIDLVWSLRDNFIREGQNFLADI